MFFSILVTHVLAVAVEILGTAQIDPLVDRELEFVVGEVRVADDPRVGSHLVVKLGNGIAALCSVSEETTSFISGEAWACY